MAASATLAPDHARSPEREPVARPRPLVIAMAVLALAAAAGALTVPRILSPRATYDPSSASTAAFEDATGLRLLRVASTGAVGLVEVQYQIVNAAVAADTLGHDTHPVVLDESSGRELASPFMGHAAHPVFRQGADFFVILEDTGHVVGPGALVSVVVGDQRLEHVPVE